MQPGLFPSQFESRLTLTNREMLCQIRFSPQQAELIMSVPGPGCHLFLDSNRIRGAIS